MKKLLLFSIIGLALSFTSCKDDDSDHIYVQDAALEGLTATSISFDKDGGEETFSVKCAVMPSAKSDVEWVIVNRIGSANNLHTFSVTASANTLAEVRTGHVTISSGKNNETVTVTQEAAPATSDPVEDPVQPSLGIKALDIAKDIRAGWNIGNTLEACDNVAKKAAETLWGNPKINEAYVAGIKAAGFNAVRIPCAWDYYIIDENNTIDPSWLDRVNEVVGYVLDQDMYAILNIHWDGGWLENNIGSSVDEKLLEKQSALWSQIASRLGHYDERLMFAGLNEPNASNQSQTNTLLEYEQAFIDAVRASDGNNKTRTLIFQGPTTDINNTNNFFKVNPTDPSGEGYLMAEIHYYDPSDYTIMGNDGDWSQYVKFFWGKDYHLEGSNRNVSWGEEDHMQSQFRKMKTKFVDKGIPVIIGEFGAYPEEHVNNLNSADKEIIKENIELVRQGRAHFYNCVLKYGKENGLIPFVWDTGELISRSNGNIPESKQYIIDTIMEAAGSVSSPY